MVSVIPIDYYLATASLITNYYICFDLVFSRSLSFFSLSISSLSLLASCTPRLWRYLIHCLLCDLVEGTIPSQFHYIHFENLNSHWAACNAYMYFVARLFNTCSSSLSVILVSENKCYFVLVEGLRGLTKARVMAGAAWHPSKTNFSEVLKKAGRPIRTRSTQILKGPLMMALAVPEISARNAEKMLHWRWWQWQRKWVSVNILIYRAVF